MTEHLTSDTIHGYLDGELSPEERRGADEHLAFCASCTQALAAMAEVVTSVRALPAQGDPPRDLWGGIEGRIREGGSDEREWGDGRQPVGRDRERRGRTVRVSVPSLWAAGIVLALASGGLTWFVTGRVAQPGGAASPVPEAAAPSFASEAPDAVYTRAVETLERTLAEGRHLLDPATVAVLDESLATIDQAIAEAERALEEDPGSDLLHRLLQSHRQSRFRVLQQAVAGLGEA